MAIKNALVVDDSKSARMVLKRMLNGLKLEVDTVESAKDAIDYLVDHTPDVIFMDHMMPEMDGFEAVKHIKSNPETAVIPIMMYTSRGGDMYLSQAKALGAVGVIPKTISTVGLKESLFKLGLVKDRRVASSLKLEAGRVERRRPESKSIDGNLASIRAETKHLQNELNKTVSKNRATTKTAATNSAAESLVSENSIPESSKPENSESENFISNKSVSEDTVQKEPADDKQIKESLLRQQSEHDSYLEDLKKLMDEQTIELHKSMWLGIETVSHEIFNRLNSELEEQLKKLQSEGMGAGASGNTISGRRISWPVLVTLTVLLASIVLNITLLSNVHKHETTMLAADETATDGMPTDGMPNEEMKVEEITTSNIAAKYEAPDSIAFENRASENMSNAQLIKRSTAYSSTVYNAVSETQAGEIAFVKWAHNREIEYPFDELALNENRLADIEALVQKAVEANYTGAIILQTHVGQFCLSRDPNGDYKLADDKLPATKCDYIGNYMQPNDVSSTHQSLSFANYLSDLGSLSEKGIDVEVSSVSRSVELSKYPKQTPQTTAAEWNVVAKLNNRITVKLKPFLTDSESAAASRSGIDTRPE